MSKNTFKMQGYKESNDLCVPKVYCSLYAHCLLFYFFVIILFVLVCSLEYGINGKVKSFKNDKNQKQNKEKKNREKNMEQNIFKYIQEIFHC